MGASDHHPETGQEVEPERAPKHSRELAPLAEHIGERHRPGSTTVVGISGGVAAGKSTLASALAALLTHRGLSVAVVPTDGFLFPNDRLAEMGVLHRKGFPETYDVKAVHDLLDALDRREPARVPVYDHHLYDIGDEVLVIDVVDIVIIEGLNALRFADRLDVAVYLHADEPDLRRWFTERAFGFRNAARTTYSPFFDAWTDAPDDQFEAMAIGAWELVNLPNLLEHVEPLRATADVTVHKDEAHTIVAVEFHRGGPWPEMT